MKTALLPILFVISILSNAQEATNIKVHDTRLIENLPSEFKKTVQFDFKSKNVANQTQIIEYGYSVILSVSPWVDDSGGPVSQLAFNKNGLFLRSGYCGNNGDGVIHNEKNRWDSWNKIIMGDSKGVIQNKLEVNGIIRSTEVKIEATGWSDFVFHKDYKLPTLQEVEAYIKDNGHLPDIPSEKDVIESGISVGEMQAKLLQKIEELTLYVIEQQKEIKELKQELKELKK